MCDDELPSRILNIWAINTHTYTRKYNRVVCICKLSARLHRQLCGQTPEWLTAAGFLAIACYLCACVCAGRQSGKPGWGNNNTMHVVFFFGCLLMASPYAGRIAAVSLFLHIFRLFCIRAARRLKSLKLFLGLRFIFVVVYGHMYSHRSCTHSTTICLRFAVVVVLCHHVLPVLAFGG